jgi:general bacterial porin, GBP family
VWWVGGDYRFRPRLDLAIGFYDIDTYNDPEVGKAYLALAYSLLADFTLSSRFDAYVGIMVMRYSGGGLDHHAPIDAYSGNALYGTGLRFRF